MFSTEEIVEETPVIRSESAELAEVKLKNLCVLQRGNKFYYPKCIPQKRSPIATNIICIILALFFGDLITNDNPKISVLALYILAILIQIGLQIFYRMIMVFEEVKHLHSRYDQSYITLLKDAFQFPVKVYISVFIFVLYIMYYSLTNDLFFTEYQFSLKRIIFLLAPSIYLSGIVLELNESPLNISLWLAKDTGLDYGSGMAYSFVHGYLNLVLPKTGTQEKNLKELMQDYEDQNHVQFSVYKLFILIPKSLNCFTSLENEFSPSIKESSCLLEKKITVAGVPQRSYKNAVYKINSAKTKSKIYVSAEYATPLKTFKDVFNTTGEHSAYYEKHKNDIILQFYLTLKKALEKSGLSQFCELIYFDDSYKNQDNQLCYYDVGKIILTRLKELKKHEKTD